MAKDPQALTLEQQAEAIYMLRDKGMSQWAVAKHIGCSPTTIHRLAKKEGISSNDSATKKATAARRDYNLANRLELGNKAFDRLDALMNAEVLDKEAMKAMYTWSFAFGILTDKRRLEDGEATSRAEVANTNAAREAISGKLDQLARAREARLEKLNPAHSQDVN